MFRSKLMMPIVALSLVFGAGSAQATPSVGLYLAMDGSGSISNSNFTTQVNAYVGALNNVFAAHPSFYGQVAIGGGVFGRDFFEFFMPQEITNSTVLGNLTMAISNLDPGRGGIDTTATAIGDALTASANSLIANLGSGLKLIIDVTTDGANNTGSNPAIVAASLTPLPIDAINCLGIGGSADCSFVTGSGTDFGNVATFGALEAALETKLTTEIVPEPGTMAIFAMGLFALGFIIRRHRAA